jgi:hypothetical protein
VYLKLVVYPGLKTGQMAAITDNLEGAISSASTRTTRNHGSTVVISAAVLA